MGNFILWDYVPSSSSFQLTLQTKQLNAQPTSPECGFWAVLSFPFPTEKQGNYRVLQTAREEHGSLRFYEGVL